MGSTATVTRRTGWWHDEHGSFECQSLHHLQLAQRLAIELYGRDKGGLDAMVFLHKNDWSVWHDTPPDEDNYTVDVVVEPIEYGVAS